jgi:hypothetical protein
MLELGLFVFVRLLFQVSMAIEVFYRSKFIMCLNAVYSDILLSLTFVQIYRFVKCNRLCIVCAATIRPASVHPMVIPFDN